MPLDITVSDNRQWRIPSQLVEDATCKDMLRQLEAEGWSHKCIQHMGIQLFNDGECICQLRREYNNIIPLTSSEELWPSKVTPTPHEVIKVTYPSGGVFYYNKLSIFCRCVDSRESNDVASYVSKCATQ